MASKNEEKISQSLYKRRMKTIRNRSGHRVEIMVDGKIVVVLPNTAVNVPADFVVPNGIGLYEKQ